MIFRKQYRSTRPLTRSFAAMATTNDTMKEPTTANEADKLLSPAQMALTRLLNAFGDVRGYGSAGKALLEKDSRILIEALSAKEPCRHETGDGEDRTNGVE